jgi:VIT1/CCC1 family predicted Fe2+/Mn2+ transporter
MRELVFALEDGIVSTGGAVVGIAAGTGDERIVVLSGMVIIVVAALSTASGTFLSNKSVQQLLKRRIQDERKEIEIRPQKELKELEQLYRDRGFDDKETAILIQKIKNNKDLWLEEMTCKELGIGFSQLMETRGSAEVAWLAYLFGGFVPIIPFVFLPIDLAIINAFILSLIGLFIIGYWKARVTKTNRWRGGLEMMFVAASAGLAGYLIGRLIGLLTGFQID